MLFEGPRRRTRVTVPVVVFWSLSAKQYRCGTHVCVGGMGNRYTYIPGNGVGLIDWNYLVESGLVNGISARICAYGGGIGRGQASKGGRDKGYDGKTHLVIEY